MPEEEAHESHDHPVDLLDPHLAQLWSNTYQLRRGWRENLPDPLAKNLLFLILLLGAWGVLSGYALFVLVHESVSRYPLGVFVAALLVASVIGLFTEYLRERIEHGHAHAVLSRLPVTILMLGIFELFISAWHVASEMGREWIIEAGLLILGDDLAGKLNAPWAAVALGALWVVEGAVLAAILGCIMLGQPPHVSLPRRSWRDALSFLRPTGLTALVGGIGGACAGALGLLFTVFVVRTVAAISLMITEPQEWSALVARAYETSNIPFKLLFFLPIKFLTSLWLSGHWGPLLTIAVLAAVIIYCGKKDTPGPILVLIGGLLLTILSPLVGHWGTVMWMAFLAAVVWVVPGLCLGFSVPLLKGPAAVPELWGIAAFLAAAILMIVAYAIRTNPIGFALAAVSAILIVGGIIFWRGGQLTHYWPLAALILASYVGLLTAAQQATFSGVLQHLSEITAQPTAPGESATPSIFTRLQNLKNFQLPADLDLSLTTRPATLPAFLQHSYTPTTPSPPAEDLQSLIRGFNTPVRTIDSPGDSIEHLTAQAEESYDRAESLLKQQQASAVRDQQSLDEQLHALDDAQSQLKEGLTTYLQSKPNRFGPPDEWPDRKAELALQKLSILKHHLSSRADQLASLKGTPENQTATANLFELAVTGSLAFWITVGLLVGSSARQHQPLLIDRPRPSPDKATDHVCFWATGSLQPYHDTLHGRPPTSDGELFARLCLEILGPTACTNPTLLANLPTLLSPEKLAAGDITATTRCLRAASLTADGPKTRAIKTAATEFTKLLQQKTTTPTAQTILQDWSARAAQSPDALLQHIRTTLKIPPATPLGNFLLATSLTPGAHFAGCIRVHPTPQYSLSSS